MKTRIIKNLFFMWKLSKFFMYQLEQTMNFSFNVSGVRLSRLNELVCHKEFQ